MLLIIKIVIYLQRCQKSGFFPFFFYYLFTYLFTNVDVENFSVNGQFVA